jgi:hypothetical protein
MELSCDQAQDTFATSGLYPLNEDQIAERGARLARRDDREYREYLREEQRRQTGCPAREVVLDQRIQATRSMLPVAAPPMLQASARSPAPREAASSPETNRLR